MRLLYFLERAPRDAELFVQREIREVMRHGHPVHVAFPWEDAYRIERAPGLLRPGGSDGEEEAAGRPVRPPSAVKALVAAFGASPGGAARAWRHARGPGRALGSGFRQAVALAREARRIGADIVHAHFAARACEDAMLAAWLSGVPFTFTAHGYDVHREPPADYAVRGESAAAVVTVSEDNARVLRDHHGVPAGKIRVIPLGVDTACFRPGGEPEPGLLASVIRLHPDKGPDVLLDAAEELLLRDVDFRLEILGDGEMREALRRRLTGSLAERVRLVGWGDERAVIDLLGRCSIFVLPSRAESLGVALMEAMACGRPVVATDVGGVPEVLGADPCGVLVPPEDPRALAEAIGSLLADRERRCSLAEAGRRRVVEAFRLERNVARLEDLWRDLMRSGAGRGAARGRGTA